MRKIFSIILILYSVSLFALDATPPEITGFNFLQNIVDVTNGSDTLYYQLAATDDMSGLSGAFVHLESASGAKKVSSLCVFENSSKSDTTQGYFVFDEHIEGSVWSIHHINIFDMAGNSQIYDDTDLLVKGFHISVTILSDQDIQGPHLTGFTLEPNLVDVCFEKDTLFFSMSAIDSISGLSGGFIQFKSPTGKKNLSGFIIFDEGSFSDTATSMIVVERFTESGLWSIDHINLLDVLGNQTIYTEPQLRSKGFPITLSILSKPDIESAQLLDFALLNQTINVSTGEDTLYFQVVATDSASGLSDAMLILESESGLNQTSGYASFEAGSIIDTTQGYCIAHQFSETGVWTIKSLTISDLKGNIKKYEEDDFLINGYPREIFVSDITSVPSNQKEKMVFLLEQNYPNPFNPVTTIKFALMQSQYIELNLFDMLGKKVKTLHKGFQSAGSHQILLIADELSSGVYFYELKAGSTIQRHKCLLLK